MAQRHTLTYRLPMSAVRPIASRTPYIGGTFHWYAPYRPGNTKPFNKDHAIIDDVIDRLNNLVSTKT